MLPMMYSINVTFPFFPSLPLKYKLARKSVPFIPIVIHIFITDLESLFLAASNCIWLASVA